MQVGSVFDDSAAGGVVSSSTPAGRVARRCTPGPTTGSGPRTSPCRAWCAAEAHTIVGPAWEIYGDWDDDPTKLETEVLYRLAD